MHLLAHSTNGYSVQSGVDPRPRAQRLFWISIASERVQQIEYLQSIHGSWNINRSGAEQHPILDLNCRSLSEQLGLDPGTASCWPGLEGNYSYSEPDPALVSIHRNLV